MILPVFTKNDTRHIVRAHWFSLSAGVTNISYKVFVFNTEGQAIQHAFSIAKAHHEDNGDVEPLEKKGTGHYEVLNRGEMLVVDIQQVKAGDPMVASGSFGI